MSTIPSDCPHVNNEREVGELCATVESLKQATTRLEHRYEALDGFLREHMSVEERKFDELRRDLVALRITMAKWLGGGVALMIASDWLLRAHLV